MGNAHHADGLTEPSQTQVEHVVKPAAIGTLVLSEALISDPRCPVGMLSIIKDKLMSDPVNSCSIRMGDDGLFENIWKRLKGTQPASPDIVHAPRHASVEERADMTDRRTHGQLKAEIARRLEQKFDIALTRRRSYYEHRASDMRFIIAVSQFYPEYPSDYWYGYNTNQQSHLAEVEDGFFVLGCLDTGRAFAVPAADMNRMARHMNTTSRGHVNHHVFIRSEGERIFIYVNRDHPEFDIRHFEI